MPDRLPTALLISLLSLPLLGFVALFRVGASRWAGWVAAGLTSIGLLMATYLTLTVTQPLAWQTDWVHLADKAIPLKFQLDSLGRLMLVLVHLVALLVQLYSLEYLHDEPRLGRYFAYLQLFVGAMLGIILAGNLLILYGFWELVGLASFLLIGFWYDRPAAAAAAKKAFLTNRVGDAAFLLGILMTYRQTDSFAFADAPLTTGAGICLFMGCVAKSAQFPLLTWLPDAMEGPTPVSALLHAATMVAAGIFLLARIHPMLSPDALLVVTIVGTLTTLWAGFSALYQTDIKRVLAFSTVSQLGLMVAAMGTGNVGGALFHLLTHAFFKAALFLAAGSVIHAVHTQDMRQMGGLRRALPFTFITYLLAAAALAGVPLLSGFLSKEVILGGAVGWAAERGGAASIVPVALLASSALTALYMARQVRLIFFGETSVDPHQTPHEPGWLMRGPVLLLVVLSVGFWFSLNPIAAHHSWLLASLNSLPRAGGVPTLPEGPAWLGWLSAGLVGLGGWLGFRLRDPAPTHALVQASVYYGYLDQLYDRWVIGPVQWLASLLYRTDQRVVDGVVNGVGIGTVLLAHLARFFDRFGIDGLVNGAGRLAQNLGGLTRSMQSGRVQTYIATAVAVVVLLLLWMI
ncbi:NADH-quinone oxidoreductase subunit L [Fibrella sp. WM1]|uniref:NADH-quinone oxidoreductase subunit 5 family protein n=1 Tax=Fibrella musci TaxID=3242485 RepID=UPI0035224A38